MNPARTAARVLALATLVATLAPAQDEAAYDRGYVEIRSLIKQAKWTEARSALEALLVKNKGQAYVVADKQMIVEDHRQCCFWAETKVPKPEEVITGKIEAYDAKTGKIRVVYGDDDLSDWSEITIDLFQHPMVFRGDFSLTIEDQSYPEDGVEVLFDFDGLGRSVARFGTDKEKASLRRVEGYLSSRSKHAAEADTEGEGEGEKDAEADANKEVEKDKREAGSLTAKPGKPFVAQLKAVGANVELLFGKQSLVKGPRTKGGTAQLAVRGHFGRMVLEGEIEPSWFEGAVDEILAARREDFERGYRPEQSLPEWLFEPFDVEHVAAKFEFDPREHAKSEAARELLDQLDRGEFKEGLEVLQKLGDADFAADARAYLQALVQLRLGDAEAALPLAKQALDAAPQVTWRRVLYAQALDDLGRPAEALPLLQKANADDPGNANALAALFTALLRSGDVAAAEHLVRNAKCKFGLWEEAYDFDRMLAMRRRGPAWARQFEATSPHYEVHSDIDAKVCAAACRVLEESYACLTKQFAALKDDKDQPRFQVFLFAGESGYQEYNDSILGQVVPHTAGLYSSTLKQLLIWNVPQRESMVRTIRHEGFHQFLDRVMHNPPVWLNEGMAEYWETARLEGDKMVGGQLQRNHLATLTRSKKSLPKLKEFVYGGRGDFYRFAQQRYAQGWALVTYLQVGPDANRKIFQKLWNALRSGGTSSKASLDGAFEGVDWEKFEADFWKWLGEYGKKNS